VRPAARPRPDDQLRLAVAGEVGRPDGRPAAEGSVERHERRDLAPGLPADHLDVRPAAYTRGSDDVLPPVPVHVAAGQVDPAGEVLGVGVEAAERTGELVAGAAGVSLDVRTAPRPGGGDQVGVAVVVDVPGRHPHPAVERRVERLRLERQLARLGQVGPHLRGCPRFAPHQQDGNRQRATVGGGAVF
jgi:hypothetical protein